MNAMRCRGFGLVLMALICGDAVTCLRVPAAFGGSIDTDDWDIGPFVKREEPILRPTLDSRFHCPVRDKEVRWEEQNVYNPAAVVRDGKVYLFYRADDRSPDLKWGRTCRIGMAHSEDGVHFARHPTPVVYPDNDPWRQYEWEGGCEDLHIVQGEDGAYYMNYTTWSGSSDTVSVASSRDLIHWTKHGPAFRKAGKIGGRSGVVVSRLVGDRLVAAKINGKYWMYYTHPCALAWSDNLIDWTPTGKAVWPAGGHEAGAIALLREDGILLLVQGGHAALGAWTLRQALIDRNNLTAVLKYQEQPFLYPEYDWEKQGFTGNTTVANSLVCFKGQWLLYYGAADHVIGLATCAKPARPAVAPLALDRGRVTPGGALAPSRAAGGRFDIVRDGRPASAIVIAEQPSRAAQLAALELQSHLLKITGVELPLLPDVEPTPTARILVGESAATRALGLSSTNFAPQEYLIGFRSNALVLIGRDWADTEANRREMGRTINDRRLADLRHTIDYWKSVGLPDRGPLELELPGVFDDQGTCYATYDFLERFCGVRWYGPTDLTSVIPKRDNLSVQGEDVRRAPALKHRNALSRASWPFLRGQWGAFTEGQVFLHWRRLRLGGEKWAANHTIHRRTIETVLNDPEYQAQGPAKGLNLCYTHPKLVQALAQMAREFFDQKGELPEGFKAMGDYFAIVPEDVATYCACERCRALLDRGNDMRTGFFSSGEISDYWFSFVNAVARELRQTHPDKYIATLAYWNYAYPPRDFDLEPNVSIAPCLHTCAYAIDDAVRENDMKLYRAWLAKAHAPIFLWNYYHHPMEPALIDKWKCFPNVMVHETARATRMFIQDGIRGIFECGEQDQLEHYVMLKLWDDPGLDTDVVLDEFFTLYFGAAARPMNQFYRSIEKIACDQANYPPKLHKQNKDIAWANLGTSERMNHLAALLAEADTLAGTEIERERVALWRNSIWKWMLKGRADYEARTSKPDNAR